MIQTMIDDVVGGSRLSCLRSFQINDERCISLEGACRLRRHAAAGEIGMACRQV